MRLPLLRQLTLASLITLGLTACGGGSSNPPPSPSSSASSVSSEAAEASSTSSEGVSSSAEASSSSMAASSSEGTSSVEASSSSEATSSSEAASSSIAPPPDLEPAAFSFESQTDVERGATITSTAITVSEIDAPTSISISGGTYAINGGDYVQGEGAVENGDNVTLRLIASEDFSTESTATLTVGGISGSFTVITEARDTMPETFSFAPLEDQELEVEVTSGTVTIDGINDAAAISVENGLYSIDGGGFTAEASQIDKDQTLALKATTPASAGATKTVTVTVGGVAGVWTISTLEDTEPPEAAFVFPTPMTATEADTVIVRGTATDELSTVTRVALEVSRAGGTSEMMELTSESNFSTWQETVTLADGENTITVIAEDEFGNVLSKGASVTVVKQLLEKPFPDAEMPFDNPQKLVYDESRERVLFGQYASTGETGPLIYSVNVNTGKRSAFLTKAMVSDLSGIDLAAGLEIAPEGNQLLVLLDRVKSEGPGVLRIDLDTKEYEVLLTRDSQPDDQPNTTRPTSLRLDPNNSDQAFMLDSIERVLISLDLTAGVRALISSNDAGFSGPVMNSPNDFLVDAANNRILIADNHFNSETLYWVDIESGDRSLLLAENFPENTPMFHIPSMATDDIGKRIFGVDARSNALWSVNTTTGERTILSSPKLPHVHNKIVTFQGAALSNDTEYLIGVDSVQDAVFVIDLKTGERVILSKN